MDDLVDTEKSAGLDPYAVDHGVVAPGIGIVVFEYGLFVEPQQQSYFAINGHLYAGCAALYGFDDEGETVDLDKIPEIQWMDSVEHIEREIAAGRVKRPQIAVNGKVQWQWPQKQSGWNDLSAFTPNKQEEKSDGYKG